jgi:predicted nucleotidyltransferase
MVSELDLDKVVARIVDFYHPEQVILFGSYACGMPHEGSDIDLLIVKETNENPVNRTAGIRNALKDILLPMDILVYTPTEIAKDKDQKFTFIHDVFKLGKILYANK